MTRAKMKKILPSVVRPVKRCGVANNSNPMAPDDKGSRN